MIKLSILSVGIIISVLLPSSKTDDNTIAEGEQPQIAADNRGIVRVVFGRKDTIFCVTSSDQGSTFSKPVMVAKIPEMHLGMSRGPQIASSASYSIITAMDKSGDIHCFQLNHSSKEWKNMGTINDLKGSTPEGLMSTAADKKDNFYAVWLDTRTGNKNQIYFSSASGGADHWSKNTLVYQSPDGHVCECCKPSIAAEGSGVAIMFRNWLNGSRDLYLLRSLDKGRSFKAAEKLGMGTWKLNGCPMDGGGVYIAPSMDVYTVWQREGNTYYCKPGQMETQLGKGRACSIAGTADNVVFTMQSRDTLKAIKLRTKSETTIGTGNALRSIVLPDNKILCVWEQDNKIKFRRA
ncbi:hypothetical protein Q4E93_03405 [Flavitalea sp. BT771]|uniref:hypothetical protein n=1 Tax=Flavitalea sp. BT771 TaxID=3063329 RepID=UPI0026E2DA00|nr:hypothetical protein [Flavitalea sp. BT771]MDO6429622.1 hypothetical protein [Flavitalea sp. BT771]MDV6218250.1 hypothetical protein [Flavitalea sp. BT771]